MPPKSRKRKPADSSDDEAASRASSTKMSKAEASLRARQWAEERKAKRAAAAASAKSPAAAAGPNGTPVKSSKTPSRTPTRTTRKSLGTTSKAGGAVRKKAAASSAPATTRAASPARTPARKKARVATTTSDEDSDGDSALGTTVKPSKVSEADERSAAKAKKQAARLEAKRAAAAWAEARRAEREGKKKATTTTNAAVPAPAPAPFNSPTPPARSAARRQRPAPAAAGGGDASLFDGETVEMEDATAPADPRSEVVPTPPTPAAPAPAPIPAAPAAPPTVPTPPPAAAFGRLPPAQPTEAQIEQQEAERAAEVEIERQEAERAAVVEAQIERQAAENAAEAIAQLERRAAEREAAAVAAAARRPTPSGDYDDDAVGVGGGLRQRRGAPQQQQQQESAAARYRAEAAAAALVRSAAMVADPASAVSVAAGQRPYPDAYKTESEAAVPLSPQERMEQDFNDARQRRVLKTHAEEEADLYEDAYEDVEEKKWLADKRDRVGQMFADLRSFFRECMRYAGVAAVLVLAVAAVYFAVSATSSLWALSSSPSSRGKGEAGGGEASDVEASDGGPAQNAPPINEEPPPSLRCFADSDGVPSPDSITSPAEVYGKWFAGALAEGQGPCFTPEDEEPLPCPDHGRCAGRYLRDCLGDDATVEGHPIFMVSETFDECVLSPAAEQIVENVTGALIELMVERVCSWTCVLSPGGTGCSVPNKDVIAATSDDKEGSSKDKSGSSVSFDLRALVKFMNGGDNEGDADDATIVAQILPYFDEDVVRFGEKPRPETEKKKKKKKGEAGDPPGRPSLSLYVGLADEFVVEHLPLPTLCYLRILLLDLVTLLLKLLFSAFNFLVQIGWGTFYNYPLPTTVAVVGLYVFNWVQNTRRRLAETRALVSNVRELAYDKLVQCDDGEGYAMLFLRDDLGHEMHPDSALERKRMFNDVWPKVVREVRHDNRVRKVERTVGGKPLEHWEWIATGTAKKSRRRGRMVEGF